MKKGGGVGEISIEPSWLKSILAMQSRLKNLVIITTCQPGNKEKGIPNHLAICF